MGIHKPMDDINGGYLVWTVLGTRCGLKTYWLKPGEMYFLESHKNPAISCPLKGEV